jgi:uncharacterized protein YdhG (YjbR/CyaY superfamily)
MNPELPQTIDEYIAGFPEDVQARLNRMRQIIRHVAPDAEEAIKYRMPTFVQNGNLCHFAAFARHIGFYPTPSALVQFQDELTSYPRAKGSIQFPLNQPMPFDLIERIVRFRVEENRLKAKPRPSKSPPGPEKTAPTGSRRPRKK